MKASIGETLAELRRDNGLKQKDVAVKLSAYGFSVNAKTIHNWEKNISQPNIKQFLALCDILSVDDVLWRFAEIQKGPYAGLNKAGRHKARELIDLLQLIKIYTDAPEETIEKPRLLRLYDIPVSAGTGNFLDESNYEMIEAPGFVPGTVDYALRVSGDSMEPLLQDMQMIWVESRETLNNGDIGIFTYSGDVYCKKLIVADDKACLRSMNPDYEDIEIIDDFGFRILGKVII